MPIIINNNRFAQKTIHYILSHPNCQQQKIASLARFIAWQIYKRITHKYIDLQLLPQVKIRCYPDSRSTATVLYCGLYDYEEMNFLIRYLRPEDSFLDIGANIGVYTLLAASKIINGCIYSFEVLPKNFARLQENINLNQFQQVKTYQIAISNQTGNALLNLAEGDSMPFITSTPTQDTLKILTDTLDQLLQSENIANLTLAKMDIEGAELLALQGATSLLKQHRPHVWILEINQATSHFGHTQKDVVNFLASYGYGLYRYQVDTYQILPMILADKQGNNVLAIADDSVDFVRDRLAKASNHNL